jgi:hypothetical protein
VLILHHGAIRRLVEQGKVDVWTPAMDASAGVPDIDPDELLARLDEIAERPEPALNIQHVVRRRHANPAVTAAKAAGRMVERGDIHVWKPDPVRRAILQHLAPMHALAAGFKTTDEFFDAWRARYATGPLMHDPIPCWVVTYVNVALDIPQFLARPVPLKQGDYTSSPEQAIDEAETFDGADREQRRALEIQQAKLIWRMKRKAA